MAENIILSSEYVKFLLESGFICTDIAWCLEYQRGDIIFLKNKSMSILRTWYARFYRETNGKAPGSRE